MIICDASASIPFPYSVNNLCHSILPSSIPCPPSTLHHLITPSPLFLSSIIHLSHHLFHISIFWLCSVLFLSSQHLSITPCLPVPTLTTYYSGPCDSVSHFLHSPYYPIHHTTPSLVVYKSFWLVVHSLACNCCYSVSSIFTPSPLFLPVILPPNNTIPLCLPCLSPPKLKTTLFLGKGTTHKLKPSPYPYTAVFCLPYTTLYTFDISSAPPRLQCSFDLISLIPSLIPSLLSFIPSL